MPLKENTEISYSNKFTLADYEILLSYPGEDCSHPNMPWECCIGCGLDGCSASKNYEGEGYDI